MSKNTRNRILLTAIAALLLVTLTIGGTVAWLADKTNTVTNTFTPTAINIDLTETFNKDTDGDGKNDAWVKPLVPGATYAKDPTVTVKGSDKNVDIYLFVQVTEPSNASYLEYTLFYEEETPAYEWKQDTTLPPNVWYTTIPASASDITIPLLVGNTVKVDGESLTIQNMPGANLELTFAAYACQVENIGSISAAWNAASAAPIYPASN